MSFKYDEETIVYLSRFFGKNLTSLAPLRENQDSKFVANIRKKALEKMGDAPKLQDPKLFYVGSVDYMVVKGKDQHEFVILESNGGSSRGLLSLSLDQVKIIYNAYKTAIDQSSEDKKKFVIIGSLPIDDLFQEKIMLINYLKSRYAREGVKLNFYHSLNYPPFSKNKEDITVIISDYNNLIKNLSFENQYITFKGTKVDVAIGDGIARRFPTLSSYIKRNWKSVKTTIVNTIYHVTDDKFNTYVAISLSQDVLNKYRIHPLRFGKFFKWDQLKTSLENLISSTKRNYIIKPFGGSGGAGIQPILKDTSNEQIPEIIEKSIDEFHQKFGVQRF